MARRAGVSQPHLHNVLKGTRSLSAVYADQIVTYLNLSVADLLSASEIGPGVISSGTVQLIPFLPGLAGPGFAPETRSDSLLPVPRALARMLMNPVFVRLAGERRIAPYFLEGDMVLVDRAPFSREPPRKLAVYLVKTDAGVVVRSLRLVGLSLYLLPPGSSSEPEVWDCVPLAGEDLSGQVLGRIVWMGRQISEEAIQRPDFLE